MNKKLCGSNWLKRTQRPLKKVVKSGSNEWRSLERKIKLSNKLHTRKKNLLMKIKWKFNHAINDDHTNQTSWTNWSACRFRMLNVFCFFQQSKGKTGDIVWIEWILSTMPTYLYSSAFGNCEQTGMLKFAQSIGYFGK